MTQAAQRDPVGTLAQALAHTRALLRRDPALAERQAREILGAVPSSADAHVLLALALAARDESAGAIAALRRAVRLDPAHVEGWRALAARLLHAGDPAGAAEAHARELRLAAVDPALLQAAEAMRVSDLPVAEHLLRARLRDSPDDIAALRMLAEVGGRLGRNVDAEHLLRRALELAPSFLAARYNLAIALHRQRRGLEAIAEIDRLLEAEPDNPAYRNLSGAVHGGIGAYDEAIAAFEDALAARPGNPALWMSYGHTLKTLGRQADSIAAYRRGIALRPTAGECWWSLANLKTVKFDAADRAAMTDALADAATDPQDRFHLHFALGKAHEDAGDWAASFRHYAEGNRLRRQQIVYDADETHEQVERARALFTPEFFAARAGWGAPADDPIFVLGMPRSGSTLVEQILASHSAVEGTRELSDIQAIAHRLSGRTLRGEASRYPDALAALDADELRGLGEEYLERTRIHRRAGRRRFIDKMPNNWAHVGLIRLILPNATIIDTRRDPMGCCFSNFKQHFARGQAFSYALADLGRYYADYAAMMAHIDAVLPGQVHRARHEAMVEDTEAAVRALLAHAGLGFEPACLRFWETDRAVQTASSEQVRRPIFREGLDQWRHFAPWLGELAAALGTTE